jgi:hypothetical protein
MVDTAINVFRIVLSAISVLLWFSNERESAIWILLWYIALK